MPIPALKRQFTNLSEYEDFMYRGLYKNCILAAACVLTALCTAATGALSSQDAAAVEKTEIIAWLSDNPCETVEQRYAGIEACTFVNAVEVLDRSYVNIIDYRQMALAGVKRCELLAATLIGSDFAKTRLTYDKCSQWLRDLKFLEDELNNSNSYMSKNELIYVFEQVVSINGPWADSRLITALLIEQFSRGALASLDHYTMIYWPSQARAFEKVITNQFTGIGINFAPQAGGAKIVGVLPNTPAYNSGIEVGDTISAIDGERIGNMPSACIVDKIAGPAGTKVTLTISEPNDQLTRDITLERSRITVPSIHGWRRSETGNWDYIIDNEKRIAYMRISAFTEQTTNDFTQAIGQLESNTINALVLDLRSNPGGLLVSAVEIADKFIKEGLLLRVEPRVSMPTYLSAHHKNICPNYPIAVLVDANTASAAEILAGILADPKYKRAVLIGQKTYGKGSVQSITSCGGEAQLKYTIGYYYLPSGQRVNDRKLQDAAAKDWGITPDIFAEMSDGQRQALSQMRKANESMITSDQENRITRYSSSEIIGSDPQLAASLLALSTKLVHSDTSLANAVHTR